MFNIADIDIDINKNSRNEILSSMKHIQASMIIDNNIRQHNSGIYFCNVPVDILSNLCSLDYKSAEKDYGYFKIDLLNNSNMDYFNTRTELKQYLNKNIHWDMLNDESIILKLPHISNYYELIQKLPKINSIKKLSYFIALIRPSKKYLIHSVINNGWDSIEDKIWLKEENGFQFKKSHSVAYATLITLMMNFYYYSNSYK